MKAAAAVLALVVGTGESRSPATLALVAAVEETLGTAVAIRVREAAPLSAAEAQSLEREMGAGAVVMVAWNEPERRDALVRMHVARSNHWTTRVITFHAQDALAERGRTLGLAVASMWPETGLPSALTSPAREPTPRQTPPAREAPAARETPPAGESSPVREAPSPHESPPVREPVAAAEPKPATARQPDASRDAPKVKADSADKDEAPGVSRAGASGTRGPAPRRWIGATVLGAKGIDGPASGFGGGAELAFYVVPAVSLRLAGAARGGSLPELPADHFVAALALGIEWWPIRAASDGLVSAGLRADALALRHQLRDTSADGDGESRGRFVPGADLVARVMLRLGSRLDFVVGAGVEVGFGVTEVRTGSERTVVATIPVLRAVAEAGVRVGF